MIWPMRRLARHLLTLCSALSLMLCVAVCVMWVRSYEGQHRVSHVVRGRGYALTSALGTVTLAAPPQPPADPKVRREVEQLVEQIRLDHFFWVIYPAGDVPLVDERPAAAQLAGRARAAAVQVGRACAGVAGGAG
jgi:hypothetical protein